MGRISVAVIDDHPLFLEGVIRTIEQSSEFVVVGKGASAADAVRVCQHYSPDIILLDVIMPGGGDVALKTLRAEFPDTKIIMLTVSDDRLHVMSAVQLGVSGYLL